MLKRPLFWEMIILLLIVRVLDLLANTYHLYWAIYEFDSLVHFLAGAALAAFFLWLYFFSGFFIPKKRNLTKFLIVSVLGAMLISLLWEIYELIFGQTMVSKIDYPYDTMMDLTMGLFGTLTTCFYAYLKEKKSQPMDNPRLTFYGGVGSTTGANIMLEFQNKKLLVDCGLLQAMGAEEKNFELFKYDPAGVDFLIITHAHLDHIGKVPKLVRDGFRGKIISTPETMELARPMLEDAFKVIRSKYPDKTLFDEVDMEKSFSLWEGKNYGEIINLFENCILRMQDAGHILGSAILNISCGDKTIVFTGDLGNSPSPLLPDTEFPRDADYIVMESVYGDRNHESKEERKNKLKQAISEGIKKNSTIIIPAFSIERTQVLLYEINNMIEDKEIPQMPVFLDSPLALKVTDVYKKYIKDFKKSVKEEIKRGDDIFDFPGLHIVKNSQDSAEIENTLGAKIILAGSGMSEGGRVVNHEEHYLPDPKATIILVGYQSVGTLGRQLEDGAKEIEIYREDRKKKKIKVRAKIEVIKGYSSHKDSEHLLEFVEKINESKRLTKVFVIMGEPKSSLFLTQRIRDYLGIDAIYPGKGMGYRLS